MRTTFILTTLLMTGTLFAQQTVELPLWPNGAPHSNGATGEEVKIDDNRIKNVITPTLTLYLPKEGNGKAIIMCPGGGYGILAIGHEGHHMAEWFNKQGIAYGVLKYRLPNGNHEVPLSDAQQAMRIVRERAKEWNIHPQRIGIMGASAGGHLASTVATHFTEKNRPDFQILLYPVVTMNSAFTHQGSRTSLLGKETANKELIKFYSNEEQVTTHTPPAFILLSDDDTTVLPQNSIHYYLALLKNGISTSLHIYPIGGHGWGFNDSFTYKAQWTAELEKWLKEIN